MNVTIYHNPKCSKSRKTLELLLGKGIEPTIIEYLINPPDSQTLVSILKKLDATPRDLLRVKEPRYSELSLANPALTPDDLIEAMVANPILIERPIVVAGTRAVLGRPPNNINELSLE
ncbi:MAG TPA: arsenate reductase (glutaredoxin) [Gammaproteobacteria bacterium]|mgnify:CR=1 FL=1|nr:arsenate reductase (glutaredoxin) [Gammaproteobacteria bacterium]|tara:strand:- start:2196 stop:2549 length:354 start_codon:yes stop_codon:yes gene_type:complete